MAEVDVHNISLLYLRRDLLEILVEEDASFHDKVVGSFVKGKIGGGYMLFPVTGTCKAKQPYKVGERETNLLLKVEEPLNRKVFPINAFSNHEFITDEECKFLKSKIDLGFIDRPTVDHVHEKAMALQPARDKYWLKSEGANLSHCDTNAREEHERRRQDYLIVHSDPVMDPSLNLNSEILVASKEVC